MKKIKRTVMRYYGGKFILARWIVSFFPNHLVYTESFGGAASVLMQKTRSRSEIYNDIDQRVVNVFRVLRDKASAKELQRRCELTPYARAEFEWAYEKPKDNIDAAHKMIFLSFSGFGSDSVTRGGRTGFRNRRAISGTNPASDWANYSKSIPLFTARLQGVLLEKNTDAKEILLRFDSKSTLHYVDPPYVHSVRRDTSHGYRKEMSDEQHIQLASVLHKLKGMIVLSGYDCKLYADLYKGWEKFNRHSHTDGGRRSIETVWLSPNVPKTTLF
jgi:DNA adenine methylase